MVNPANGKGVNMVGISFRKWEDHTGYCQLVIEPSMPLQKNRVHKKKYLKEAIL